MNPVYRIEIGGANVNFNDRLMSIDVVQHVAFEADKLTIVLDDRDNKLKVPPTGKKLECFLGFKETSMQSVGTYVVDAVTCEWIPKTMIIEGSSADFSNPKLKAHVTKNYENKTIGDVIGEVAGDAGLGSFVDPELKGLSLGS